MIGVLTVAFNSENFIKANIKQFKKIKNKNFFHVVVVGTTPWRGNIEPDNTAKIALNSGAYVRLVSEVDDATQRNIGLEILRRNGVKWTLVVDSDEFWTEENINKLLDDIDNRYDIETGPNMRVYWKDWDHLILPSPQPDNPIVAMRTNTSFSWSRLSDNQNRKSTEAEFHHLSYVRDDKEMLEKITASEHAHEIVEDWYQDKWINWKDGDENLHPVIPHIFHKTTIDGVPSEIKELF